MVFRVEAPLAFSGNSGDFGMLRAWKSEVLQREAGGFLCENRVQGSGL